MDRWAPKLLATSSNALVTSSFLLLVVRPGAPSRVLAPSSDALVTNSFLLLVVMPLLLVAISFVTFVAS